MIKAAERSFYLLALAGCIILLLMMKYCSTAPKVEITVKTDTVYRHVRDTIHMYTPTWLVKTDHDTVTVYVPGNSANISLTDTAAILKDYLTAYYYVDSIGTGYGTVKVEDTIRRNRITARRWYTDITVPEITTTKTQSTKLRNQIYIGMHLAGSNNLFSGFGPGILLKTRADKIYQLRGTWLTTGNWLYQVEADFKLSLHK